MDPALFKDEKGELLGLSCVYEDDYIYVGFYVKQKVWHETREQIDDEKTMLRKVACIRKVEDRECSITIKSIGDVKDCLSQ